MSSCSSGQKTVSIEQYEEKETALNKRERDIQEKTIEMLDLKNQIIILQSEVGDLKENIGGLKTKNDSLSFSLVEERSETKILNEKLDEVDLERIRLQQNNNIFSSKLKSNSDSLKQALEKTASIQYESNILKALDSVKEQEYDSAKEGAVLPVKEIKTDKLTAEPTASELDKNKKTKINDKLNTAIIPVMKLTDAEYQQRYNEALDLYFSNKYDKAVTEFAALLTIDNTNDYSDNCQYWIAESYYSLEKFDQALSEFKKVLTYKDSNKNDHALFKSGMCNLRLKKKNAGYRDFQTLIEKYPKSELVSKVRDILESDSF